MNHVTIVDLRPVGMVLSLYVLCSVYSDMKSVSSILAAEFLSDVHCICSSSQDEDVAVLGDYLMQGRGGVILKVLQTIGVQVG